MSMHVKHTHGIHSYCAAVILNISWRMVKWSCTGNTNGRAGQNVSCDLHLNHECKMLGGSVFRSGTGEGE